jgi:large subunit ribosomal protein L6
MQKMAPIPEGVTINVDGFKVDVKGKAGELNRDFYSQLFFKKIKITKEDTQVVVSTESEKRKVKSAVGTIASHIRNMVTGVQEGFTCQLKIAYVHFPMTAKVNGSIVLINNFLGEKNPRKANILDGCKVEVKKDIVFVTGINKELVMQTAANIENATRITSRDRRVYQDGIFILK